MVDTHWVSWNGLEQIVARRLKGAGSIGMGTRPYGVHAGNMAALFAYPFLLCEETSRQGYWPNYNFTYWLNDTESSVIVGADGTAASANPANLYPGSRTFQCTRAPAGFSGNLADYWQPLLERAARVVTDEFPRVRIRFRRASELTRTPSFATAAVRAITRARDVRTSILGSTWYLVRGPSEFMRPVCPSCEVPVVGAKVTKPVVVSKVTRTQPTDQVTISCQDCGTQATEPPGQFKWWTQFRMLHAIRMSEQKPDVWMMGADHLRESRSKLRHFLERDLGLPTHECAFLYSPLVLADQKEKMGKSSGNTGHMPLAGLISALRYNFEEAVNLEHAPVSRHIEALGAIVPPHIARPEAQVMPLIEAEAAAYWRSNAPFRFVEENTRRALALSVERNRRNLVVHF